MTFDAPEDQNLDVNTPVTATITTSCGDIVIQLDPSVAPDTVNSFVFLARSGYFDGSVSHRIVPGFVFQAGDPTATGMGGPGYTIPDEFGKGLAHTESGIFSMANAGPNSGGSQFFITLAATPWLDGKHAVFGKVADKDSLDVLMQIRVRDPGSDSSPGDTLNTVEIVES